MISDAEDANAKSPHEGKLDDEVASDAKERRRKGAVRPDADRFKMFSFSFTN